MNRRTATARASGPAGARAAKPAAQPARARGRSPEFQALLDATVDGVVIIDAGGRIEVFNRAAERLFGYTEAELIGRGVGVLMTDADRAAHAAYMKRYLTTGVPHIIGVGRDVLARRRDGSTFPAFLSVGRIGASDPPRFVGLLHDTTLREQALHAVQLERDRANQYLDIVQTALVVLDGEGRVTLVNRKGLEILGRSELELIGHDWIDAAVAHEDRAVMRARFEHLARDSGMHYCEYRVRTAKGAHRLMAWRCIAMRDGDGRPTAVMCSGEDITERRRGEQIMERTRALLQEAQSIARVGNFELHHPDERGDYWSPQIYRIFGLDPERVRLTRERSAAFVHPDDRARFEDAWRQALRLAGAFELHLRIVAADGDVRFIHARYQVFDVADGRRRIAGTLHDVTDRLLAEEEARRSEERMTHVSRLATLGEMAAGIAHELNQPLAAIATYAQASERLLAAGASDPNELRVALGQIAGQALRAGEVIRRLRSLAQKHHAHREPNDLNALVTEVAALMETDARLHDVRITLDLAPLLPPVSADRVQIQQVLLNLIRNAIEALEDGEGRREIVVSSRRGADDTLEVLVCDNGPGVAPQIRASMFDPFCTTKRDGTGLGLAISRSIVEAHQGALRYRANESGGACFSMHLPSLSGA